MSTLSESVTSPPSPPVASPPNKVKRTRWPAAEQQYNKAFKHATITYAREKAKEKSGMPARMVTEIVRNEFKVNLCPRTIQKKVKDEAWSKGFYTRAISIISALPLRFLYA